MVRTEAGMTEEVAGMAEEGRVGDETGMTEVAGMAEAADVNWSGGDVTEVAL